MGLLGNLFGGGNGGKLKSIEKIADQVESWEPKIQPLSDQELRAKTDEFRGRLEQGETLDDLLPEAFAVVREAAKRTVNMRHFHVQIVGGIVLHQGRIAEMRTGEGKTLVSTLPAYLNALAGKGVHIVTVNDYLAKRDSQWMGKIHRFLGLSVGLIYQDMGNIERKEAYACDITYGTNNQFGFDYLRDNMVVYEADMVQRPLDFAIIDEVDSILIDEARTPLIISGRGDKSTDLYEQVDKFVKRLKEEEDYVKDEKKHSANLTDEGVVKAEKYFNVDNLADIANTELNHHINQGLAAHYLKHRDKDYVVQDGEVVIVDEFTGRLMNGRRYSNGLHQAIEAKEGVKVEHESKTLATITFQNYFRMYRKLSGMTGTAVTEEEEFNSIYGLDVVVVPTNEPTIREDKNDKIFLSPEAKYEAVVQEVIERHAEGQPILVGTVTVEDSEHLSSLLRQKGIKHNVLNAKNHTREAEIIAQAGKVGAVTIATNMAGRGTDIMLGGNPDFMARRDMMNDGVEENLIEEATSHAATDDPDILAARKQYQELHDKYKVVCDEEHKKIVELGGLYIIGTQRHESRRIDNQLRGRAGRQGDPGASVFYVSMKDDLMRLFGGEGLHNTLDKLANNGGEDVQLQHGIFSKRIENVQKKVEAYNLQARKNVLKYDDVMNQQREVIYGQRRDVLRGKDLQDNILDMARGSIEDAVHLYITPDVKDFEALTDYFQRMFEVVAEGIEEMDSQQIIDAQFAVAEQRYREREQEIGQQGVDIREIERIILLQTVDRLWMDHIDNMDQLRQGIGLRAFAQRDPLIEYTMEGFDMFEEMSKAIQEETVRALYHVQVQRQEQAERKQTVTDLQEARERGEAKRSVSAKSDKVGRNEPCPCGSGKKYKNCCGK